MRSCWIVLFSCLVLSTVAVSPCDAQPTSAGTVVPVSCDAMATINFADIQDAPTQIVASATVAQTKESSAYCDVKGYVSPQVNFEIQLPTSRWNGKFMEIGCAGTCGIVWLAWCAGPLNKGYACIGSDMGHEGTSTDGLWAYNNLQAEVDWAYRATHVVALAGKAIAERFYGRAPNKSYFIGCSTGGRQGLIEAQRFPWDFDGIVAGAPAIDSPGGRMRQLWDLHALLDDAGHAVLDSTALRLLHDAALAQCDSDDGIKDGIISSPRSCKFDPSKLLCNGGQTSGCLSRPQIRAAEAVYAGPTTSRGERIYAGGLERGSELEWADLGDSFGSRVADFFRYMGFTPPPGARWSRSDFDFDRDYKRLDLMNALYSASNPDLRRFKGAGGKLILYHGWADKAVAPSESVDYFETVERTMGGSTPTREFFRLFMVPGMSHCSGGAGAFAVDYLSYLENWVERGEAPDRVVAAHVADITWGEAFSLQFPLAPGNKVSFTRAVYPYPMLAKYKGRGDPNDHTNFEPVSPVGKKKRPPDVGDSSGGR